MFRPNRAVVRPQHPPLQQGHDTMDAGRKVLSLGLIALDPPVVHVARQPDIAAR
jgi:hypothetical protein